jgi:hypothetical protein
MVLDPGRYLLKLIEPAPERNVLVVFETVQLWTGDGSRLLSTMLTMPNYDRPADDKTALAFFDREPRQPKALRLWFAPGRNYAQEFVYPKAQAVELAKSVGRGVLSMPPELPADIGLLARVAGGGTAAQAAPAQVTSQTPPSQAAPPAERPRRVQARQANVALAAPPIESRARAREPEMRNTPVGSLPKTASYLPLLAFIGMLGFAGGAMLRILTLWLERG